MIAKLIKGKGFRGAVEYDLQPNKCVLLETNMAGSTPRDFAAEFNAVRDMRPKLAKAVGHVSISLPPDEHLTDDQWREVAHTWMQCMGFVNNQYIISRHNDSEHPHIHILVNRITLGGQVVSDSHDYKRQESIIRGLERQFGLRKVSPSREVGRTAPKKGELEHSLRTGKASARMRLQNIVDTALGQGCSLNTFRDRLALVGVEVRLNMASTGFVSGISFALDGVAFKGSKLGKSYTWNSLQQRGLRHEQNRGCPETEYGHGIRRRHGVEQERCITDQQLEGYGDARSRRNGTIERHCQCNEQTTTLSDQELYGSEYAYGGIDKVNQQRKRQREIIRKRSQGLSR